MKKRALYKNIIREVSKSKGRFFSIFSLIALGAFALVGLKVTGPNMATTATSYFNQYHLADVSIVSTYGLNESDQAAIASVKGIKTIEYGYSADAIIKGSESVLRIFSLTDTLSQYEIEKGSLPKGEGEIAVDASLVDESYQLGDTISFVDNQGEAISENLKHHSFKIVGFVRSSEFIQLSELGNSPIGTGQLNAFGVVTEANFDMEVYTIARLNFTNTVHLGGYDDEYQNRIDKHVANLEEALKDQPELRLNELKHTGQKEIEPAEQDLEESRAEIQKNQDKLNTAKSKLEQSKQDLSVAQKTFHKKITAGENQLKDARKQLESLQSELNQGTKTIKQNSQQLEKAKLELQEKRKAFEEKQQEIKAIQQELQLTPQELTDTEQALKASEQELLVGEKKLAEQTAELTKAKKKLIEGKSLLQTKKKELEAAETNFAREKKRGQRSLDKAQEQIQQGEKEYQSKRLELEKANKKILEAEADIKEAKDQLNALALPVYMVRDRTNNPGYTQFVDFSQLIDALSNVFPVFLFAIAALVCLTTMTRMVEEQRTQMGTLKALGYNNNDIMKKFVLYGCTSSVLGAVLGIIMGHEVLTRVIFSALGVNFIFESLHIDYFFSYSLIALVIAILCTSLATILSVRSELKENAVSLMRPKPPANGSRILLERVTFIWKKMSFAYKVTARNLFRYKKRMFMTIFGVAGCTALLMTGFGIKDSLHGIITPQFEEIIRYDLLVIYQPDSSEQELKDYHQALQSLQSEGIISAIGSAANKSVTVNSGKNNKEEVTLIAPNSAEELQSFVTLRNRQTQKKLALGEDGAIITEKLAKVMEIGIGDSIEIKDEHNQSYKIKVAGITEMYMGHYLYISPTYYQSIFKEQPQDNASLIVLKDASQKRIEQVSDRIMKQDATTAIFQSQDSRQVVQDVLDGLNGVVFVIILAASLLAIVVLYNLTNLNVSERIRELSTTKVLGFYPIEVTMYVFRETILLTLLGILAGYVGGYFLHRFILEALGMDSFMFSPDLLWSNYALSAGLTIIFSLIVMIVMYRKLKAIDMIEALKSVE